jgi:uncharacterized protein (DUF342 family)
MNRQIIIRADTAEEALALGAQKLGAPISELLCSAVISGGKEPSFSITHTGPNPQLKATDTAYLLEKLESELADIEIDEMAKGLTAEELEEKGYIGNKNIEIKRSPKTPIHDEKNYTFAGGIEYYTSELFKSVKEIPFESIEYLKDVTPQLIIAEKKYVHRGGQSGLFQPQHCHSESYLKTSNVGVSLINGNLTYSALIKGKVVLANGLIYVLPGDIDSKFKLWIAPDKMSVEVELCPSKGGGKKLAIDEIKSGLRAERVAYGIKDDAITKNIAKAETTGIAQKGVIIAEGLAPIDGGDSEIKLLFNPEPVFEDFKILPDGRVDYRKQMTVEIVKQGALLATVSDAKKGIEGKDVFGNSVKAKEGDSKVLYAGTNVEKSKDGLQFLAGRDGQPVLNKNILNVFPLFNIPGDVNFNSGNVQFDGNVTIQGSVLPGFEVKASGDIFVMNSVDSGNLDAGRDIKVFGGIFGGAETLVKCGRNLVVSHLQNALVEAQGDVIVRDSAVHCKIFSTGSVVLREGKGTLVGGTVHALRSVDAKVIGSPMGTKTEITVGHDFFAKKMRDEFLKVRDFCKVNIEKIEKYLKPLVVLIKDGNKLPKDQMFKVTEILKKHNDLKSQYYIIEAKIKEIEKASQTVKNPVIKVNQVIYPDVKITINDHTALIAEKESRVSFSVNAEKNALVKGNY